MYPVDKKLLLLLDAVSTLHFVLVFSDVNVYVSDFVSTLLEVLKKYGNENVVGNSG